MDTLNDSNASPSLVSDSLLQVLIGVVALLLGAGVWLYAQVSQGEAPQVRPRPIWLGIAKVTAQMSDGRMLNVKVNLSLPSDNAVGELRPHMPAFQALIEEAGTRISREDVQGSEGMRRFGASIRGTLNDYLDGQDTAGRIKDVVFDELMLLP
jgi:flagellar basal body-associated protein FliL